MHPALHGGLRDARERFAVLLEVGGIPDDKYFPMTRYREVRLDARTGALLWKASLGGQIVNGPMTYQVDGRQYVAVISGNSPVAFALRE